MVTHPWGLREHEQRGDDTAKDFCPHVSPSRGFGDGQVSSAAAEAQGGGLQLCNLQCQGEKSPPGPSSRTLTHLAEAEMLLLAIFTSYFHRGPLTATDWGLHKGTGRGQRQPPRDEHGPHDRGKLTLMARCSPRAPCFPSPRHRTGTLQISPPIRDPSTLGSLQRSPSGVPRRLCHVPAHG